MRNTTGPVSRTPRWMATHPLEMTKEIPDSREFGTLNLLKIARRGFSTSETALQSHPLDILRGHSSTARTR